MERKEYGSFEKTARGIEGRSKQQDAVGPAKITRVRHPLIENRSNVIIIDDDEPVPAMAFMSRHFTAEEDGELLRLREKFGGLARWDQIGMDFNAKFPKAPRSLSSLKGRYMATLREAARPQIQGAVDQRQRAVAALKRSGTELQVNDPFSDSSSGEEEDGGGGEEEEEEEENDGDDEVDDGSKADRQREDKDQA